MIENGYLYIAQPPLYRAKRGSSERYLKDDRELDAYLIDTGAEGAVLTMASGTQIAGPDLVQRVNRAAMARNLMQPMIRKVGSAAVVEQAAIAGALNPDLIPDATRADEAAKYIAHRLDELAAENERGWQGEAGADGGLVFQRRLRGVTQRHVVDGPLLRSAEAHRLDAMAAELQSDYLASSMLTTKEKEVRIDGPLGLIERVLEAGRKGVAIQRYKGLGEMNAEQLWETTLDPEARSLLQVKVAHGDEADDLFSTLMGDIVEPRREFIQHHALEVSNLDV
jgi:DNA gyrase subunit B